MQGYDNKNFRHRKAVISEIPQKQYQAFWRRNWRKLGHHIFCNSNHSFGKMNMMISSPSGGTYFYPIISERFQVLKIRVSLTNPRSASSRTRMDTSNRQDLIFCYFHLRFSLPSDLSHQLDDKLGEVDNFQAWKCREVQVPEGDEV